jgi:hypothetical protein
VWYESPELSLEQREDMLLRIVDSEPYQSPEYMEAESYLMSIGRIRTIYEDQHDEALARSLLGAAGELQAAIAEIGATAVTESDMRSAMRRALQMQLGPRIDPEAKCALPYWPRVGAADLAVRPDDPDERRRVLELKWCRTDKLYESLWDVLKVASARQLPEVGGAYVVVAAPESRWGASPVAAELFDRDHSVAVADVLTRLKREWTWLLAGVTSARPVRLPEIIAVTPIADAPIHVAEGEDWSIRAIRVAASDTTIDLVAGWRPADAFEHRPLAASGAKEAMRPDGTSDVDAVLAALTGLGAPTPGTPHLATTASPCASWTRSGRSGSATRGY